MNNKKQQTKERDRDKMKKQNENEIKNNQSLLYYIIIVLYLNSMRHMMKLIKLIDFLYNFDNKSCVLLLTTYFCHVISVAWYWFYK